VRYVPLRSGEVNSRDLFKIVATQAPNGTRGMDEVRARLRILDALEKCLPDDPGITLEDQDWSTLKALVTSYPYVLVNQQLGAIIDDVENASAPAKAPARTTQVSAAPDK
jgi:hypothetical protein